MHIYSCLLAGLLLLSLTPPTQATPAANSVTVGDPAHADVLPDALQAAYAGGARRIVVKPGVYALPAERAAFVLDGWKDAAIVASGVTFVQTDSANGHDVFQFNGCNGVTLTGPTITRPEVTHYQGRVVAVGTDTDGTAFCDWKPDAGYPVPPAGTAIFPSALNVVDAHTRLLKVGVPDYYRRPMEAREGGAFRVHFAGAALPFAVGDWVVGRYKAGGAFKVFLKNSTHCTVQDVTFLRNGFATIREAGGGGNRILHCRWLPGPRPDGASEDPLVCDASDGLHSTGANPGPDIEHCVFRGVLLDDCLAIHGSFYTVKSVTGRTLILDGAAPLLAQNEPVRLSDTHGFYAEAQAVTVTRNPDGTTTLTLDKDFIVPVGAKLSNPQRAGAGYKILGCTLGGTRSRGILAKADGGVIANNTITGCGQAAISVGPEYYWNEADYAHDVQITGNTITGCGFVGYGGAAVFVHGDGALGNANIVVQNNTFTANYASGVQIEWTDGATLTANTFAGPIARPASLPVHAPLRFAHCRNVTLSGNTVTTPALYPPALAEIGDDVSGLLHNDASGIHIAASAEAAARPR